MTYDYAMERHDIARIDKLNNITELRTYWKSVRKLTYSVKSDHAIKRWQCLADARFDELKNEYLRLYKTKYMYLLNKVGKSVMNDIDYWIIGCDAMPLHGIDDESKQIATELKRMYIALHELDLM